MQSFVGISLSTRKQLTCGIAYFATPRLSQHTQTSYPLARPPAPRSNLYKNIMKKLLLSFVLACASLCAQAPSCITILDTVYSMGPTGSTLMTGYIQLSLGYFTSNGGFTITQSVTTLTITAKTNNLSTCITPSVVVQAAYTVTTGGRTPVHYTTYWYIPNTGGPYQLTSVPSGFVNVSGTPGIVSWISGLNFALASTGDTPTINGSSAVSVASVQSITQLTLLSGIGTLTNAIYSDGPIERSKPTTFSGTPPSIFGPPGAPGTAMTFGTPVSSSASCTQGDAEFDAAYIYTCTATNTWRRVATASF